MNEVTKTFRIGFGVMVPTIAKQLTKDGYKFNEKISELEEEISNLKP